MDAEQANELLTALAGHLQAETPQETAEWQELQEILARSLLPDEPAQAKGSRFAFENADLFLSEQVAPARAAELRAIAEQQTGATPAEPEYRVFVREVPVRSTQLHASVPLWAGGAQVERTLGPFTNADGRQFWFDFYRIERLVALYIQGSADPALLFHISLFKRIFELLPSFGNNPPSYSLPAGSIWIRSQLLAADAPAGYFTGLTIKGGTITLSAAPQAAGDKITVANTTTVRVQLDLEQPAVTGADPTSPYGVDARAMTLELPARLSFRFSGQAGRTFEEISDARWTVYGDDAGFEWNAQGQPRYDSALHRVRIPFASSATKFEVTDSQSPFDTLRGTAAIVDSAWALPAAPIDIANPTPAAGEGGLVVECKPGLTNVWTGLEGELALQKPLLMVEPGRIALTDLTAASVVSRQALELWKDQQNPFGSSVALQFPSVTPFFYNSFASGAEAVSLQANAEVKADRPVTVAGLPPAIFSKDSLFLLAATKTLRLVYLFDDNILMDAVTLTENVTPFPAPIALALRNALFKVTPVNGCLLAGTLDENFVKAQRGWLFLTFGLLAYLPTLPDPYAANIGQLKFQFREPLREVRAGLGGQVWMWLVCQVQWNPGAGENDTVKVSFHFASLQNQFQLMAAGAGGAPNLTSSDASPAPEQFAAAATQDGDLCGILLTPRQGPAPNPAREVAAQENAAAAQDMSAMAFIARPPDYTGIWDKQTLCLLQDLFALLDVSTNADLMGISFAGIGGGRLASFRTFGVTPQSNSFPLQVEGMDVVSRGNNVRAFTVPQISWEPVLNTAPQAITGDPPGFAPGATPTVVPNYYPNDGGPTHIYTNSVQLVPLAPLPVTTFVRKMFNEEQGNITSALFTLPFGMRALAVLTKFANPPNPPSIQIEPRQFANDLRGGLALEFRAGKLPTDQYPMFNGATVQTNNVLDLFGNPSNAGTLGSSVGFIFNDEFKLKPNPLISRGVPVTRMDFSGYGASIFSAWFNPNAQMAQTSQTKFDVWVGRTGHEVVQVRSIIYPWGIRVVRTIILYRAASGYEYRVDTGWQPESDGRFDFSYYLPKLGDPTQRVAKIPDYHFHPGVVKGLFNVKNIVEQNNQFPTKTTVRNGETYLDDNNYPVVQSGGDLTQAALLQMVTLDADVEIEGVVQGAVNGRVPSKKIMGWVQLAPRGIPLSQDAFVKLLNYQPDPIGGPVDCVVDVGKNGQRLRVNRFDVSNAVDMNGVDPIFVVSARGSVILPKEGSWSMVQHTRGTGEVTPLPPQLAVPLVRAGELLYQVTNVGGNEQVNLVPPDPTASLLRLANPGDLLRPPAADTLNYGFLLSTDTQKALFLTPAYKLLGAGDLPMLLSKTPPLFVDAFRIANSKAIFPNVGDASANLGHAISLLSKGTEFTPSALTDGGKQALELMQINKVVAGVEQEGYKLLKKVTTFDLPNTEWTLIQVGTAFKIYIEYKANNVDKGKNQPKANLTGALNFDVDSFAAQQADRWKSLMSNVGLVVDLGPVKRLMTIKGNWDAKNGAEAQYGGGGDIPSPQIEFAPELKPVIDILQILQDLQSENYKDAFQKGLKLAMSNKAGSWEYKLDASKEIPVVKFPPPPLDNDPNAPLKLEAGLKLGAYFNAALMVTTDPKQLLPTAGGFLGFTGKLSVMCVSISIATVYAVGQVQLDIGADTKAGATLRMKFGFGAQVVVGLPVVGNVSVLYMVGVEIYTDATKLQVSGFLLFQGQAELLGGLIGITITIEAKGTVSRANDRTDLAAQVTFAIDISIFLVIDISFSTSWQEQRQIA